MKKLALIILLMMLAFSECIEDEDGYIDILDVILLVNIIIPNNE